MAKRQEMTRLNAVVEVATAQAVATVSEVVAFASVRNYLPLEVPASVVTSTTPVLSLGSHSISAVAPDAYFKTGGLAVA